MKHKIIGLREELYIGKEVSGHNCDFEYTDKQMTRHIILMISDDGDKVELLLEEEEGECGSGWCSASYGVYSWNVVSSFAGKTHKVNKGITLDITPSSLETGECSLDTEAFYFSQYGGCFHYPTGGYSVEMDLFEAI